MADNWVYDPGGNRRPPRWIIGDESSPPEWDDIWDVFKKFQSKHPSSKSVTIVVHGIVEYYVTTRGRIYSHDEAWLAYRVTVNSVEYFLGATDSTLDFINDVTPTPWEEVWSIEIIDKE